MNLTGAKDLGDLVDEHLPDVFALSSLCPRGATVVDVGAGGGLPGVPFAMLRSDCSVTLVEPRSRRVAFLHAAVRMVVQGASVVRGRVEDLDSGSWSFALSRATFSPVDWIVHASRIVTPNGLAAVLAARPTGSVLGPGRLSDAVEYTTGSGAPRWAGIYRFT